MKPNHPLFGKQWARHLVGVGGPIALLLLNGSTSNAALVIDGFLTYQQVSVFGPPAGFKSAANSLVVSEAIGGERDLYVERTSANVGTTQVEVASPSGGIGSYNSGVRTAGNGLIVWDGIDGSAAVNPTGLGGLDLTQGALNTAFQFGRTSDLGGTIRIRVYQDATHVSEASIVVTGDPSFTFLPTTVPFSGFTAVGSGGGADFSNIGALTLGLEGGTVGSDIALDSFVAVPEASTMAAGIAVPALFLLGHLSTSFRARRTV